MEGIKLGSTTAGREEDIDFEEAYNNEEDLNGIENERSVESDDENNSLVHENLESFLNLRPAELYEDDEEGIHDNNSKKMNPIFNYNNRNISSNSRPLSSFSSGLSPKRKQMNQEEDVIIEPPSASILLASDLNVGDSISSFESSSFRPTLTTSFDSENMGKSKVEDHGDDVVQYFGDKQNVEEDVDDFQSQEEKVSFYKQKYEAAFRDLQIVNENYIRYQKSSEELEKEYDVEMERYEQKVVELSKKLSEMSKDQEKLKTSLREKVNQNNGEIQNLLDEISNLKELEKKYAERIRDLDQRNLDLETKLRVAEASVQTLTDQNQEESKKVIILQAELKDYKEQSQTMIQRLKDEVNELQLELTLKVKTASPLNTKDMEYEKTSAQPNEASNTTDKEKGYKSLIENLQSELSSIRDESNNTKLHLEQSEKELDKQRKLVVDLQLQISKLTEEKEQLLLLPSISTSSAEVQMIIEKEQQNKRIIDTALDDILELAEAIYHSLEDCSIGISETNKE
ncbi:hypothetical protein ABK040_014273 [Willaertia magna]